MSKKNLAVLLSFLLIIAFFLPYLSYGPISYSGWNVVFGNHEVSGLSNSGRSLYLCLLIPGGALLLLIGILTKDGFTSSGIIYWAPLIGVAYIIIMLYLQSREDGGMTISEFISVFGYALWLTLIAAIILPFTRS